MRAMNFLNKLSITKKIYLIPIIGSISFVFYLTLSTITANNNVQTLSKAKDVQFPVVQYSKEVSVSIVRISEMLSGAVTTGDIDTIDSANNLANQINTLIDKVGNISPEFSSDQQKMKNQFENLFFAFLQIVLLKTKIQIKSND